MLGESEIIFGQIFFKALSHLPLLQIDIDKMMIMKNNDNFTN